MFRDFLKVGVSNSKLILERLGVTVHAGGCVPVDPHSVSGP
jgi:hypothetical protein